LFVCAGVTRQGMVLIFHTVEDDILGIKKTEKMNVFYLGHPVYSVTLLNAEI